MLQRDIKVKWFFAQPPQKVWECLTNADLLSLWLMKTDFKPVVGHEFKFYTKPLPKMGFDGIVHCQIIEIVPLQKLVYSWKGGPGPGVITLDTVLVWTLEPKSGGTEIRLEHKGFKGLGNFMSSLFMSNGWRKGILRRFEMVLKNYVQGTGLAQNVPADC